MANNSELNAQTDDLRIRSKTTTFSQVDFSKTQHSRMYVNHVGINSTLFDVRIVLSDVEPGAGAVAALHTLTVLMSPELAKITHLALGTALENYSKMHGEFRLPAGISISESESPLPEPSSDRVKDQE